MAYVLEAPIASEWACSFFSTLVCHYNYLTLVRDLVMRAGMGPSLGFSSLGAIDDMDLYVALELQELLRHLNEKIMPEGGSRGAGRGGESVSMRNTILGTSG